MMVVARVENQDQFHEPLDVTPLAQRNPIFSDEDDNWASAAEDEEENEVFFELGVTEGEQSSNGESLRQQFQLIERDAHFKREKEELFRAFKVVGGIMGLPVKGKEDAIHDSIMNALKEAFLKENSTNSSRKERGKEAGGISDESLEGVQLLLQEKEMDFELSDEEEDICSEEEISDEGEIVLTPRAAREKTRLSSLLNYLTPSGTGEERRAKAKGSRLK